MTPGKLANRLTLITGANGKTGRRVAERLQGAQLPVRLASRSAAVPFDWDNRATWEAALSGVDAVYVTYQPDLAVPSALETVHAFFGKAVGCGVERLVLLSGRGEPEAEECERALQSAGVDWTILRASWFAQNFSETFMLDALLSGTLALPSGPAAEPFVDAEDIADVAFAALTDDRHINQLYEISGPRALTFQQATAEIAQATGRKLDFVAVDPQAYAAELAAQGMPKDYVDLVIYLFTTVLDGRNTPIANGIQRALGRAPTDFADYVRRTAAAGVWTPKP